MVIMATGTGKTTVASQVVQDWPARGYAPELRDRVLLLAHRRELLSQMRDRLEHDLGEPVGLEKAESRSGLERVVVASVQTLYSEDRLHQWKPDTFGLVVYDECHHAVSPKNKQILDYFSESKRLGLTATPDRADELAMCQAFEADPPAFIYEIDDAINDGWLVPIVGQEMFLGELDLSNCSTVKGDFKQSDLDAAMVEEAIAHMVKVTVEESSELRTLLFTTSVDNADRCAELANGLKHGSARAVNGKTQVDLRGEILGGFERGEFQYLANVGIATEGYDCPAVEAIAQGKPTKSRALHAQMIGRGLRPIFPPGFDPNSATAAERRLAIARSTKPQLLVLEFTGNSGRHDLACTVDILGGKFSSDEVALAKNKARATKGMQAGDALNLAREEIAEKKRNEAARRLLLEARSNYTKRTFNPFEVLRVKRTSEAGGWDRFGGTVATEAQTGYMRRLGMDVPTDCTKAEAMRLIGECQKREKAGLARFSQIAKLKWMGIDATNLPFQKAADLCWEAQKAGGKRLDDAVVDRIIGRERSAGEDA
jgi:superfamily II DNA or RNA helicase